MPPRDPELPEGTDQIINGAAADEGGGGSSGGFVARGGGNGGGTTDKLVAQVRDQVTSLRGQAGDKLRSVADDGKSKATGLLDDVAEIIEDAARSIDERLGEDYGDYAHRASTAVSGFAGRVRDRTVDDIIDDTRDIVRKQPGRGDRRGGRGRLRADARDPHRPRRGGRPRQRRPERHQGPTAQFRHDGGWRRLILGCTGQDPHEESIGDLFGRLIEDGRTYARAEIDLYKEIARHRAGRARERPGRCSSPARSCCFPR